MEPSTHYIRVDDRACTGEPERSTYANQTASVYDEYDPAQRRCESRLSGIGYPKDRMANCIAADRMLYGADENQVIKIEAMLSKTTNVQTIKCRTNPD